MIHTSGIPSLLVTILDRRRDAQVIEEMKKRGKRIEVALQALYGTAQSLFAKVMRERHDGSAGPSAGHQNDWYPRLPAVRNASVPTVYAMHVDDILNMIDREWGHTELSQPVGLLLRRPRPRPDHISYPSLEGLPKHLGT